MDRILPTEQSFLLPSTVAPNFQATQKVALCVRESLKAARVAAMGGEIPHFCLQKRPWNAIQCRHHSLILTFSYCIAIYSVMQDA